MKKLLIGMFALVLVLSLVGPVMADSAPMKTEKDHPWDDSPILPIMQDHPWQDNLPVFDSGKLILPIMHDNGGIEID